MKKTLATLFLLLSLAGCGPANLNDVKSEISKIGPFIEQKKWREASESAKTLEDWWHYVISDYNKKDAEKMDKMIHDLELNIASLNQEKSLKLWNQLKKTWNQMNDKPYQVK